jgi:poly(3-hydroxybutyrate) depolymerase
MKHTTAIRSPMTSLRVEFALKWFLLAVTGASISAHASQLLTEPHGGRNVDVYVPSTLEPAGSRALVVVLHGGLGNAQRISTGKFESAMNMNRIADVGGFVVAYLNGTPVTRFFGDDKLGWNAGKCCGQPVQKNVNDVAYIEATAKAIAAKYGVEPQRIYGVGHSNGAMMTQRVICESSLYAAAVPISGPLDMDKPRCPHAAGKRLMAIHGEDDQNVPLGGGQGTKGISRSNFESQAATAKVWLNAGASYDLQIIKGADHSVDAIGAQIIQTEGRTLSQKIARFFGLIQ